MTDVARAEAQIRYRQALYLSTTWSPTTISLADVVAGGHHGTQGKRLEKQTLVVQGTLSNDPRDFTSTYHALQAIRAIVLVVGNGGGSDSFGQRWKLVSHTQSPRCPDAA